MLSKEVFENALENGADWGEVFMILSNTTLKNILYNRKVELSAELLELSYTDDGALARSYRDKIRQINELDEFLKFRETFLKSTQPQADQ